MDTFFVIAVFVLGAIIGSFLNVVILRYHTGKTLGGRSMCMSCSEQLSWYELIPVISFFVIKGRCTKCGSKISRFYPVVEFISGISFLLIFLHQSDIFSNQMSLSFFASLVFYWSLWSILLMIAFYDIRLKIIPSEPVYTFIFLAILPKIAEVASSGLGVWDIVSQLGAGLALASPFALLWFFSRGRLMGLGDAKIALGLGFLFGLDQGLSAILISFWLGAIFSIIVIVIGKIMGSRPFPALTLKSEIPFGPFLIMSAFIVFIFNLDLNAITQIFKF